MNMQSLSKEELIHKIEMLGGKYDNESPLSIEDQLLICESIEESTPVNIDNEDGKIIMEIKKANEIDGHVNGSVHGSCYSRVNFQLTESKLKAISELNNFQPPKTPLEIEQYLREIFSDFQTKDYWWPYVSRTWSQRQINWVLRLVIDMQRTGRIKKDIASCFTDMIKHRKKRKSL